MITKEETLQALVTNLEHEKAALREKLEAAEVEAKRLRDALVETRYFAYQIVTSPSFTVIPGVRKYANWILDKVDSVIELRVPEDTTREPSGLTPLSAQSGTENGEQS